MTKCPSCSSSRIKINENLFKCEKCGFINTNFKEPKKTISEEKPKIKMGLLQPSFLETIGIDTLNFSILLDKLYKDILNVVIKTANRCSKNANFEMKQGIDFLSSELQNNLKGFFEQIEEKYKFIKG